MGTWAGRQYQLDASWGGKGGQRGTGAARVLPYSGPPEAAGVGAVTAAAVGQWMRSQASMPRSLASLRGRQPAGWWNREREQ